MHAATGQQVHCRRCRGAADLVQHALHAWMSRRWARPTLRCQKSARRASSASCIVATDITSAYAQSIHAIRTRSVSNSSIIPSGSSPDRISASRLRTAGAAAGVVAVAGDQSLDRDPGKVARPPDPLLRERKLVR